MSHLPLISHRTPDATIARHRGQRITASRFLADVRAVAAALPPGRHVLNACADRYAFAVTLAAAMLDHRITLLPSTYTPEAVERLKEFAPDTFGVTDTQNDAIALSSVRYPIPLPWDEAGNPVEPARGSAASATHADTHDIGSPVGSDVARPADASVDATSGVAATGFAASHTGTSHSGGAVAFDVPTIHADRVVAYVFTSGSTGVPVPHAKTWGRLVNSVQVAKSALGLDDGRTYTLVGTVPPQHMFGFESTILLALIGAQAFDTGRPFYPADIVEALAQAGAPRVLVTTPVHLRSLLLGIDARTPMPAVDLVLSATAPLSPELAVEAEERFAGPLKEIYGSTETGQIATRRSAREDSWLLMPGVRLEWLNGQAWASEGHIETPIALGDLIEARGTPDESGRVSRFALTGRSADLVNIAGKRTSIGYLNHQIMSIAGVDDAGFYMPDDQTAGRVTRLAAFVVAPTLSASALMAALRERIDPAFLPRPLVHVDSLQRNETGKVARATLQQLYDRHIAATREHVLNSAPESAAPAHEPPAAPRTTLLDILPEVLPAVVLDALSELLPNVGAEPQPPPPAATATEPPDVPSASHTGLTQIVLPIVLPIHDDHPAYAGHFPGRPVLPGVVLLDAALSAISDATGRSLSTRELASAKFLSPVTPGETLTLEQRTTASGAIEFTIRANERIVARGTVAS